MHHPVEVRHLPLGVGDDREVGGVALGLLDVPRPALVRVHGVDRQAEAPDPTLVELRLEPRDVAELGGADGREVARVGEQDRPAIPHPLVELDRPLRAVGAEARCRVAESQAHLASS